MSRTPAILLTGALICAALSVAAQPAPATLQAEIRPQLLGEALTSFSRQSGLQVIYASQVVTGIQTSGSPAGLPPDETLKNILAGTGLKFSWVNERTVSIWAQGAETVSGKRVKQEQVSSGNQSLESGMRIADAAPAAQEQQNSANAEPGTQGSKVEEIVVTAQKTSQRLQDVPVPVSVIDTQALAASNQVLMRDYVQTIPSVNLAPGGQGVQTLVIRGLTTGTGNPTVAVMIDGVAYTAATNNGGGRIIPDLDPGDLERIEALRGPQGTLYGASSLGGLINFVTRQPTTDRVSGDLQAGTTSVKNGEKLGYNLRGAINLPVSDTIAVRASAFSRTEPGFIDDPGLGQQAVNDGEGRGGRLAGLWTISDSMSLQLTGLYQKISNDGSQGVDIGLGDLQHIRTRTTGYVEKMAQAYSATFKAGLGRAKLTSLTGYSKTGLLENEGLPAGATGASGVTGVSADKFVEELRFDIPLTTRMDLLFGGVYTAEDSVILIDSFTIDQTTGANLGRAGGLDIFTKYKEWAAFADLTMRFTDRFDVQFGARTSNIDIDFAQNDANHAPIPAQTLAAHFTPFNYLVTPTFKVNEHFMTYARFASGFRAGGANLTNGVSIIPGQFDPDETRSFEVGVKADFFNRALALDASVYHIRWEKIQFNQVTPPLPPPQVTYTDNGGSAKSEGIELSAAWRPLAGLSIDGWVTLSRAVLTEDFSPTVTVQGLKGFRLPYGSDVSAHLAVRQEFPISSDIVAFAGGGLSYTGDRRGPFRPAAAPLRQVYPSYKQVNLNVGLTRGSWNGMLFANNVTDSRGTINGGLGVTPATALVYITPRVIGASLSKSF